MQLNAREPIYFVGWNYHEPIGVPLKRLLMNEASPFEVKAIVHQVVMAPEVDGIPVIQNDQFLEIAKNCKAKALLMVKDDLSRSLWLRRGREVGIEWLDEGELLLRGETLLRARGSTVDLGILQLPSAFDHEAIEPLRAYEGKWPDAASNGVFRSYLQFLETGILSPLRAAAVFNVEHPMRQTGMRSVAIRAAKLAGGLAWEIATRRSSFLEQAVMVAGQHRWNYAFSSDVLENSKSDARVLEKLLLPLGIRPAASWFEANGEDGYVAHEIAGFDLPRWSGVPCFVRMDVERPSKLASQLAEVGSPLCAWIRVGRTPNQLLTLLKRFPIADMALDCDRPGPLGMQVRLQSKN